MKPQAILVLLMVLCCGTVLHADILLFDRGLPTANLNNAAGGNRSNVAWGDLTPSGGQDWAVGDTFKLGSNATISDLRVWIVSEDSHPPSSMWSGLTLYGGQAGTIAPLSAVGTDGTDPNVRFTNVTYADGSRYQGSSGGFINLYQVDFLLNWMVTGNATYYFFVGGSPTATNHSIYDPLFGGAISPFLSSSNAALSGSTQQGADNTLWEMGYTDPSTYTVNSFDSATGIWDKYSDVNVELYSTPEPASILSFGAAAVMLATVAIRRRRSR